MLLRELQLNDLEKMYEWMNDYEATESLVISRFPNSKEKIEEFIRNSWNDRNNLHFAIVTENNEYVGTVSLKNINYIDKNGEYAIAIHRDYWGKEYARLATDEIIGYGFNKLNLHKIYLNVVSSNARANKFYKKYGFEFEATFKEHLYLNGKYVDLNWYYVLKEDWSVIK